jgi:protein tyrosine phosphatase (PTP) superfamily phosphohydrolase (DUF442 family)
LIRPLSAVVALLLATACFATWPVLEPSALGELERVHRFGDLTFAGQPSPADLEAARDAGFRSVVNLRGPAEMTELDEARVVADLGLVYLSPGFSGPDELDDEVFAAALDALRTAPRPALVHCSSANRVGAIWIAYRALDDGLLLEAAVAEGKTIGLRSRELEAKARDYVLRHTP